MPVISNFIRDLRSALPSSSSGPPSGGPSRAQQPVTTYYLTHTQANSIAALAPVPSPPASHTPIPSSDLIFGLIHPPLSASVSTAFFLDCLPDPVGFLLHAAGNIRAHLLPLPQGYGREEVRWRHQLVTLVLEDKEGLAATSGGTIHVSLRWVGTIRQDVEQGRRERAAATKEFKGVLLHELVHAIQHDGFGSTPSWLTESIADYVRLQCHLGPPHWRKPGQGRRERGWEDGYDAGARFLAWVTGTDPDDPAPMGVQAPAGAAQGEPLGQPGVYPQPGQPASSATAPAAQPTKYPDPPALSASTFKGHPGRRKRPPLPDFIRHLDARLEYERYEERWWVEMAGAPLEVLWAEYLDYYAE